MRSLHEICLLPTPGAPSFATSLLGVLAAPVQGSGSSRVTLCAASRGYQVNTDGTQAGGWSTGYPTFMVYG
jgi:hypothetical protein